MRIIEPCCYNKQIGELIDLCTKSAELPCSHFFSYSDWDAEALLHTLSGYARGGILYVALVHLDASFIAAIRSVLSRTYVEAPDCSVPKACVRRLVLVTQPGTCGVGCGQREELRAQLGEFIENGRIVVCEDNIGFRCMAVEGTDHRIKLVIQGSINLPRSNAMQMFTLTASQREFTEVQEMMEMKARTKNIYARK